MSTANVCWLPTRPAPPLVSTRRGRTRSRGAKQRPASEQTGRTNAMSDKQPEKKSRVRINLGEREPK
ncbi:hypothetical protein GCM10017687_66010 [Streptomyces echinatus]|uniref:Uncharacterized protein n=1 Tax=Streptomyces echinatus TaxID=67293 RepID=A0A7W9UVA3_9ACTN|nr:hypothetical protein [Streptomyces echinatus]